MKLLSIDVGIKNLAYCVLEKTDSVKIHHWGIIDLFDSVSENLPKCCNVLRTGKTCASLANCHLTKTGDDSVSLYYCKKTTCSKKAESTIKLGGFIKKNLKKIDTKSFSLQDYGQAIQKALDNREIEWSGVDEVIIENQPVLKNPTMKSIQMMVYSYFIYFGVSCGKVGNIQLCSATNKLNKLPAIPEVKVEKGTYDQRKESSILYTRHMIKDWSEWRDFFEKHSKKDDLADSFLQGLYILSK